MFAWFSRLAQPLLTLWACGVQPDVQVRLFNILPFYSRMPRTPIFASLSWQTARNVLALYRSGRRPYSNVPLSVLLPDKWVAGVLLAMHGSGPLAVDHNMHEQVPRA